MEPMTTNNLPLSRDDYDRLCARIIAARNADLREGEQIAYYAGNELLCRRLAVRDISMPESVLVGRCRSRGLRVYRAVSSRSGGVLLCVSRRRCRARPVQGRRRRL